MPQAAAGAGRRRFVSRERRFDEGYGRGETRAPQGDRGVTKKGHESERRRRDDGGGGAIGLARRTHARPASRKICILFLGRSARSCRSRVRPERTGSPPIYKECSAMRFAV